MQKLPILRYAGGITDLYPTEAWQELMVDQVIETADDFFDTFFTYLWDDKDKLREDREK